MTIRTKMKPIHVILSIFMLLLACGSVYGATITVCASGCDQTTIQAAENVAAAGDIVYVYNGTYLETVQATNDSITFEGEGVNVVDLTSFYVTGNHCNVTGFTMALATLGSYGLYLGGDHCNISGNVMCDAYTGAYITSAENNTFDNNSIHTNWQYGLYIYNSDNNTIKNNVVYENVLYGIYLRNSDNNGLSDNIVTSNAEVGMYIRDSIHNDITNNVLDNNVKYGMYVHAAVVNTMSGNVMDKNMVTHSPLETASQQGTVGVSIDFNFTVRDLSNDDCPVCGYSVSLSPNESTLSYSRASNLVSGSFTPTREGMYSMTINTTYGTNYDVRKYVYLIDVSATDTTYYYLRDTVPVHGQPVDYGSGHDVGSVNLTTPTSDEQVYCGGEVGFPMDTLPTYLFGMYKNINYSMWHSTTGGGHTGMQRYGTDGDDKDISAVVTTTSLAFDSYNFINVDWVNDYYWTWYLTTLKMNDTNPNIQMNVTHPSYMNVTYIYPDTPSIKSVSSGVSIISATAPTGSDTDSRIVVSGNGLSEVVVQMEDTSALYGATWDGASCYNNDCNFTQNNGEMVFTMMATTEHIIEISETWMVKPCQGIIVYVNTTGVWSI